MALVDIKVPDIGDFDEVTVIELLVKPGDSVRAEQSLITVESDKASMEIPSRSSRAQSCWCWKSRVRLRRQKRLQQCLQQRLWPLQPRRRPALRFQRQINL